MSITPVQAPWPRSAAHAINAAVLGALVFGSLAAYDELPARIPTHFGFDGVPDGWADTSLGTWMAVPLISGAVTLITYGSAWVVARFPKSMNLPDRKRYDALSLADKFTVIAIVQRALFWITACLTLTMMGMHAGSWTVAMGQTDVLPVWSRAMLILLLVCSPVGTVIVLVKTSQAVSRLSKKAPEPANSP